MELFEKAYYKHTKLFLLFLGQWPFQSICQRLIIRTLIATFLLSIMIPEVIKFVSGLDDLEIIFECIPPLGLHVVNIMKSVATTYHADKLAKLMTCMDLDWKSRVGGDGSIVLHKYAARGRILTITYAIYMLSGSSIYIFTTILPLILDLVQPLNATRPRQPVYQTEYFINQDDYFLPLFFHAFLTTVVSMVIVSGCDTLYSALVHYVCALFVELGRELEMPDLDVEENLYPTNNNDRMFHRFRQCVEKHRKAIEFCDLMESTYTLYFFGVIGMNVFLISFTAVQAVVRLDDPSVLIKCGVYGFGQLMHAFFLCWHGQMLINHSEDITFAVYKCRWYNSSFRLRSFLALIIMRSRKPCLLTVGTIFPVSLETFTAIVKTAMSYFTVLSSLQ